MKKLISIVLSICLLGSLTISAGAITIKDDSSVEEYEFSVLSKNMITGEVTETVHTYEVDTAAYSLNSVTDVQPAWFPNQMKSGIGSANINLASEENNLNDATLLSSAANGILGGVDNRMKLTDTDEFPYSAICYMEMKIDGKNKSATAFMIGDNVAITAGHCVYDNGDWATDIKLYPGKSGAGFWNNPFGSVTVSEANVFAPYWSEGENFIHDWAVLVLDKDIGNETGWFGFTWEHGDYGSQTFTMTGYARDIDGYAVDDGYQYTHSGTIATIADSYFLHTMDVTEGQSGGPIYTNAHIVYGIQSCTVSLNANQGARITKPVYLYFVEKLNE